MEIQLTSDGSQTLYLPEMDEHYHSVNGAIQESVHVYLEAGFRQISATTIQVLELGFGTGLNAFLTALEAETQGKQVHYTSLEKYPLPDDFTGRLNYPSAVSPSHSSLFTAIHDCNWEIPVRLSDYFTLHKIKTDFSDYKYPGPYDVVYYDAFAPDKQPGVWSQELFNRIYASMNDHGILTTYCAKGNIRRMMLQAGFSVERIPGPPGKRQMLRAWKKIPPTVHS